MNFQTKNDSSKNYCINFIKLDKNFVLANKTKFKFYFGELNSNNLFYNNEKNVNNALIKNYNNFYYCNENTWGLGIEQETPLFMIYNEEITLKLHNSNIIYKLIERLIITYPKFDTNKITLLFNKFFYKNYINKDFLKNQFICLNTTFYGEMIKSDSFIRKYKIIDKLDKNIAECMNKLNNKIDKDILEILKTQLFRIDILSILDVETLLENFKLKSPLEIIKIIINDLNDINLYYDYFFNKLILSHINFIIFHLLYIPYYSKYKDVDENKYWKINIIRDFIFNISENNNINGLKILNSINLDFDSGGIELRNNNFKNVNVYEVIQEIKNNRDNIFKYNNNNYQIKIVDDSYFYRLKNYDIKLEVINDINNFIPNNNFYYTGDIDLNITLPYLMKKNNEDDIKKFIKKHIILMKALQLLSPLFLGCWTYSYPISFGDNHKYPETSLKFLETGSLCRILVSDVNKLYTNQLKKKDYRTHKTIKKIYEDIFKSTSDINDNIDLPSREVEFAVNRDRHVHKYNPKENKYFGFEWKIFDQIPIDDIPKIVLFVVMIAQHLNNSKINFEDNFDPRRLFDINSTENWQYKFLKSIIIEGWHVSLDSNYLELLIIHLKLNKNYFELKTNLNISDFLQSIHESLFNYFRRSNVNRIIIECYFPNFTDSKYDSLKILPELNKNSYHNMIEYLKSEESEKYNQIINEMNSENEDFEEASIFELIK